MVKAYVLVAIEGVEPSVAAKELNNIDEIENVHLIFGEYNLIAIVNSKSLFGLKEAAIEKISRIRGVVKTSILIDLNHDSLFHEKINDDFYYVHRYGANRAHSKSKVKNKSYIKLSFLDRALVKTSLYTLFANCIYGGNSTWSKEEEIRV